MYIIHDQYRVHLKPFHFSIGVDGAEPVQAGALVVFAELGLLQVVRPATCRLQDILNIDINISYSV